MMMQQKMMGNSMAEDINFNQVEGAAPQPMMNEDLTNKMQEMETV